MAGGLRRIADGFHMTTKGPPGGPPGQRGGRKRPTLDLKASEVASEPVKPPPAAEPPAAAPPVQQTVTPNPPPLPPGPEREAPPLQTEALPGEPPRTEPPEQSAAPGGDPPRKSGPAIAWLPPDFPWPLAAAAAAGVVLTLLVLALAGTFTSRDGGAAAIEVRLARAEQQLRDLAARPVPTAVDPRIVEELAARLARLETAAAVPRPPVTDAVLANRIALLEGEIRALGERIGVIARRNDEVASIASDARKRADAAAAAVAELPKIPQAGAPRAEIDALAKRIAELEQNTKKLETELGRRAGSIGGDPALRRLAVATALNSAVDRGAPFAAELDAARALAPEPKALAPLAAFAASGIPGTDALARELAALIPRLAKAAGTTAGDGGVLDRLKANAEKVIRIRPIDEPPGDDPAAVIRRIEARAEQRNLAGAVAELAKLPASARALAKEWVAKVAARDAAIEASRRYVAAALAAIAKPSL
jgi:hypothetical protein